MAAHAHAALTSRLREARRSSGLTGAALAKVAGWGQPKVSKIESGRQFPTEDDVRTWAEATGADPRELVALLGRARSEFTAFKDRYADAGGAAAHQDAIAAQERAAPRIYGYQPSIIHGLLQTADYARELLHLPGGPADLGVAEDEIDRLIAARMRRQAILHEPDREIVLLVGEAALRSRPGRPRTMVEQLRRIAEVAVSNRAVVGVVRFDQRMPVVPLHGWNQIGDVIVLETTAGETPIADPAQVANYERYIDILVSAAATKREAARFCEALAADLAATL